MVAAWVHEPEPHEWWLADRNVAIIPQRLAKITPDWHTLPVARRVIPALIMGLFTSSRDLPRDIELTLSRIDPNWVKSTEAKAAVPQVIERLGAMRVEFKTDARNERSRAALAALPARFEGVFAKHMLVREGENRDSAWYSVTDDEWPSVRERLESRLAET